MSGILTTTPCMSTESDRQTAPLLSANRPWTRCTTITSLTQLKTLYDATTRLQATKLPQEMTSLKRVRSLKPTILDRQSLPRSELHLSQRPRRQPRRRTSAESSMASKGFLGRSGFGASPEIQYDGSIIGYKGLVTG